MHHIMENNFLYIYFTEFSSQNTRVPVKFQLPNQSNSYKYTLNKSIASFL